MPEIYGNMVNFTMFFPAFSLNFDGLRCPVKKSCSYKVVAHCCEICLNPHPLHRRDHYMAKVEHPLEECIGMFHIGHVMVTTVQRVRVKTYFTAICYNLVRARFLDRIA